jgi:hypothetical protein
VLLYTKGADVAMAGLCAADEAQTVPWPADAGVLVQGRPEEEWTDFKARLDLATANGTGGRLARQSSPIWLCWSERYTSPRRSNCGCSPTHVVTLECRVVELEESTAAACERAIERVSARELSVLVVSTATLDFLSNERPDFMDSLAAVFLLFILLNLVYLHDVLVRGFHEGVLVLILFLLCCAIRKSYCAISFSIVEHQ